MHTFSSHHRNADLMGQIIINDEGLEVINFGKEHLNRVGAHFQDFSVDECQFCHIETPSEEMLEAISNKDYYILLFDDIPAELPLNPTRSQLIQYLRSVNKNLRFADLSGTSLEELAELAERKR